MGNRQSPPSDPFSKMVFDLRRDQSRRISVNPEKKYLSLMKETLISSRLPQTLRRLLLSTLQEKVSEVELIETVTCINALRNNQFESSARSQGINRDKPESKFVRVNFGEGFFRKILGKFKFGEDVESQQNGAQVEQIGSVSRVERVRGGRSQAGREEELEGDRKERIRVIGQVMRKELNRMAHPFGKLNKAFAEYVEGCSEELAPRGCKEEVYERNVSRLVADWCAYLQASCLSPYKKWIMSYTDTEEGKYASWLRNLLLQEIWAVNNGYLFGMLATVIHRRKTQLKIDFRQLQENAALLTPSLFGIDLRLQIEGHFFDSIYEMSEVVCRLRPEQILGQLQTVKKRICTDIDNYHRLVELGQVYEIDSDNILGIVAYILCKIASKIDEIHTHLNFLRIIYGDKVYYSMGLGSYMLSTVFGALQFLESLQFQELLREKNITLQQKEDEHIMKKASENGHSDTKVGTSAQGELNSLQDSTSQADHREIRVNSLLEP